MSARGPAYVSTTRTAPAACPACARVLDAATGVQRGGAPPGAPLEPGPGDVTVCAYCGTVLVYLEVGLRVATPADLAALEPWQRQLLAAWPGIDARGGRRTRQ